MKKSKILSCLSLYIMSGMLLFEATSGSSYINGNNLMINKAVSIEKLDDNHANLHYNNVLSENNDLLFTKEIGTNGYHYSISDANSQVELCNFDSTDNVDFSSFAFNNQHMCAAVGSFVWAILTFTNPLAALASAFGAAASLVSEGTLGAMVALVAESGLGSIPAVIGLLSASEGLVVALGVGGLA